VELSVAPDVRLPSPAADAAAPDAAQALQAELRKKEIKRQADTVRPLDSWERYRALNDAMDEVFERIDVSNRELRFALILMGSLNTAAALAATRRELISFLPAPIKVVAAAVLVVYAGVAGYFLLQAINGLQPRHFRPRLGDWSAESGDYPVGIRYFEDVVARDAHNYWNAWRDVRLSQINAELAVQVHSLCLSANAKRLGLRRLFGGLRVMALLLGCVLLLIAIGAWRAQ